MFDLVIRNGTVIDGSGAARAASPMLPCRTARSPPSARSSAPARREIDAGGLLVTPGFVDIHTHYDGQATWDPFVTPSSWHGVTTTVFGNCGVGFAPVRPGKSAYLINLMEGVEDIPGTVLSEGVKFNWESFPDYLDALGSMTPRRRRRRPSCRTARCASTSWASAAPTMPRCRTRASARRWRGWPRRRCAPARSASRPRAPPSTRRKDGRFTPSLSAREAELFALAEGMKRAGRGVLQVNSDFGPGEFEALDAAADARRPAALLPAGAGRCRSPSCGARRSTRSMACARRAAPPTRRSARGRSA